MKTNRLLCVLTLPLLFGLSACQDDEFTTHVSGKVVNRYTQEPIEGAYIYLKDGVGSSGVIIYDGNTSSDKRSEMYTDANGEFSLTLTGEYGVYLGVGKENYREFVADGAGIKGYGRNGGSFENQIIELEAEAGFNPLFVSKVPVEATDSLVIMFNYFKTDESADQIKYYADVSWNTLYVGQQSSRFLPSSALDDWVAPTTGDTYTPYQIAYTRNGQWETKIDSVYIKSFETYTDTIYY